jgi:hypothetical protein
MIGRQETYGSIRLRLRSGVLYDYDFSIPNSRSYFFLILITRNNRTQPFVLVRMVSCASGSSNNYTLLVDPVRE